METRPVARINAIAGAVPATEVHRGFLDWADRELAGTRDAALFARMAGRSGIARRWSVLEDADAALAPGSFYARRQPPSTAERMQVYAREAPGLALAAARKLGDLSRITHLVTASCTGFVAPGIDQLVARELGLPGDVERVSIGFMGCYAGVTALRTAGHIARSRPDARVLVIAVELCTLHLQENSGLESLLAMAQFGDGAAAALVSAAGPGIAIGEGLSATLDDSEELISWDIGDTGFEMQLSGRVPGRLAEALADSDLARRLRGGADAPPVNAWAVHPGGKSILDAVERSLSLPSGALAHSRGVLHDFGNMSSATILFVLARMLDERPANGVALAFGPGLAMEGLRFGWVSGDAG